MDDAIYLIIITLFLERILVIFGVNVFIRQISNSQMSINTVKIVLIKFFIQKWNAIEFKIYMFSSSTLPELIDRWIYPTLIYTDHENIAWTYFPQVATMIRRSTQVQIKFTQTHLRYIHGRPIVRKFSKSPIIPLNRM